MKYAILIMLLLPGIALAKPYPADVKRNFVQSCAGFKTQIIPHCSCIIDNIEKVIPFREYEKLMLSGKAENDRRIDAIANRCKDLE